MTPQELRDVKRTARVIRAARKLVGKDQRAIASLLGISQAAVSKLESEILIPSASQWYQLCHEFKIDSEYCYKTGYIDNCSSVWTDAAYNHNRFKIPKKYLIDSRSKVRSMKPFLRFFQSHVGEKKLAEYLKTIGIDPDFFLIYDNQLNMQFSIDLIFYLVQNRYLKNSDIPKLAKPLSGSEMHGKLHGLYSGVSDKKQLICNLVKNVGKYEANAVYTIIEDSLDSILLSVLPTPEMKSFNHRKETLDDFICRYKKEYLRQFSTYVGGSQVKVSELECYFKGTERCLYKISL